MAVFAKKFVSFFRLHLIGIGICLGASSLVFSQTLPDDEIEAWELVSAQPTKQGLSAFVNKFPSTVYLDEVLNLYPSAKNGPIPTQSASATQTDADEEPEPTSSASVSVAVTASEGNILEFRDGLLLNASTQQQLSILEVLNLPPQYGPPIEGLPDEIWQNGTCYSCHSWDQARLCEHGTLLASFSSEALRRIEHPFGGAFKEYLVGWSKDGC